MLRKLRQFCKSGRRRCRKTIASGRSMVLYGDYGLMFVDSCGRVHERQLEASRMAVRNATDKVGRLIQRRRANVTITSKSSSVGRGKGKGDIDYKVDNISEGDILFELAGVSYEVARRGFQKAIARLPGRYKMVSRLCYNLV